MRRASSKEGLTFEQNGLGRYIDRRVYQQNPQGKRVHGLAGWQNGMKKRKAEVPHRGSSLAPTEEACIGALKSWLLAAGGTVHPDLRFGVSALGGTGVFASRRIAAESDLFVVPKQCILSLDTVRGSRLGRELCDAVCAYAALTARRPL